MAKEFEAILVLRAQGMQHADKKCRKRQMGNVPFSPELHKLSTNIGLWEAVVKKKKGVKFSMGKLRRLESAAGLNHTLHTSLEEAEDKLSQSHSEYKMFKKQAQEARKTFIEDLAEAIAHQEDKNKATVYRHILHRESQRETGRKMRMALGKTIKGVLNE